MKKIIYIFSLILSFGAYAMEDTAKKEDILEFIRITAVTEEVLDMILPHTAQHFIEASGKERKAETVVSEAKKQILSDAFLERFVPPYDELFSHAEIKTLLQYFKSEEMKKFHKSYAQTYAPIFLSFNGVIQDILNNSPEAETSLLKKVSDFVISVSKENFKEEIQDSTIPVVLDFYATHCSPCKVMAPIFSELSLEYVGQIKFAKLDVHLDSSIAKEFGARAVPTFLFIKDGTVVDRHVGLIDKEGLLAKIQKNLL